MKKETQAPQLPQTAVISSFYMEFIEMYQVFKNDEGKIWKIEPKLIPKNDEDYWIEKKVFYTKEHLNKIGINIQPDENIKT